MASRFLAHLLNEGEVLLTSIRSSVVNFPDSESYDVDLPWEGQLFVSTAAVWFCPVNPMIPLLRFPTEYMKELVQTASKNEVMECQLDDGETVVGFDVEFSLTSVATFAGLSHGLQSIVESSVERNMMTVQILLNDADTTASRNTGNILESVYELSREGDQEHAGHTAAELIRSQRSSCTFNTKWLASTTESVLLCHPVVLRSSSSHEAGLLSATVKGLYFQPFVPLDPAQPYSYFCGLSLESVNRLRNESGGRLCEVSLFDSAPILVEFRSSDECVEFVEALSSGAIEAVNLKQPLPLQEATDMWIQAKWSNFEYLTYLNARAGRSMLEYSLYPVYPFVASDLTKNAIDVSSFLRLLESADAADNEVFMTVAHVLSLVGRNDMPAVRHFYGSNMSVWSRSVIPDLQGSALPIVVPPQFYDGNGEFLVSRTECAQNVELPDWCQRPSDLVRRLREALDSAEVADLLPKWIDCVFGVNQSVLFANWRASTNGLLQRSAPLKLFDHAHPQRKRPSRPVSASPSTESRPSPASTPRGSVSARGPSSHRRTAHYNQAKAERDLERAQAEIAKLREVGAARDSEIRIMKRNLKNVDKLLREIQALKDEKARLHSELLRLKDVPGEQEAIIKSLRKEVGGLKKDLHVLRDAYKELAEKSTEQEDELVKYRSIANESARVSEGVSKKLRNYTLVGLNGQSLSPAVVRRDNDDFDHHGDGSSTARSLSPRSPRSVSTAPLSPRVMQATASSARMAEHVPHEKSFEGTLRAAIKSPRRQRLTKPSPPSLSALNTEKPLPKVEAAVPWSSTLRPSSTGKSRPNSAGRSRPTSARSSRPDSAERSRNEGVRTPRSLSKNAVDPNTSSKAPGTPTTLHERLAQASPKRVASPKTRTVKSPFPKERPAPAAIQTTPTPKKTKKKAEESPESRVVKVGSGKVIAKKSSAGRTGSVENKTSLQDLLSAMGENSGPVQARRVDDLDRAIAEAESPKPRRKNVVDQLDVPTPDEKRNSRSLKMSFSDFLKQGNSDGQKKKAPESADNKSSSDTSSPAVVPPLDFGKLQ